LPTSKAFASALDIQTKPVNMRNAVKARAINRCVLFVSTAGSVVWAVSVIAGRLSLR
jgi:hypothetical protein